MLIMGSSCCLTRVGFFLQPMLKEANQFFFVISVLRACLILFWLLLETFFRIWSIKKQLLCGEVLKKSQPFTPPVEVRQLIMSLFHWSYLICFFFWACHGNFPTALMDLVHADGTFVLAYSVTNDDRSGFACGSEHKHSWWERCWRGNLMKDITCTVITKISLRFAIHPNNRFFVSWTSFDGKPHLIYY